MTLGRNLRASETFCTSLSLFICSFGRVWTVWRTTSSINTGTKTELQFWGLCPGQWGNVEWDQGAGMVESEGAESEWLCVIWWVPGGRRSFSTVKSCVFLFMYFHNFTLALWLVAWGAGGVSRVKAYAVLWTFIPKAAQYCYNISFFKHNYFSITLWISDCGREAIGPCHTTPLIVTSVTLCIA